MVGSGLRWRKVTAKVVCSGVKWKKNGEVRKSEKNARVQKANMWFGPTLPCNLMVLLLNREPKPRVPGRGLRPSRTSGSAPGGSLGAFGRLLSAFGETQSASDDEKVRKSENHKFMYIFIFLSKSTYFLIFLTFHLFSPRGKKVTVANGIFVVLGTTWA